MRFVRFGGEIENSDGDFGDEIRGSGRDAITWVAHRQTMLESFE